MEPDQQKPSYWAVIPASVRYDTKIPPNAKLLYAEISSLTDKTGYCYASNAYFERLFELCERTVIRLIKALEREGYIQIEDAAGGKDLRKIYAGVNPTRDTPDKNVSTSRQKCQGRGDKKVTQNKKESSKEDQSPQDPPDDVQQQSAAAYTQWKPDRFERFWNFYPAIRAKNGLWRRPAKSRAGKAWDRLRPNDELLKIMGEALRRQKDTEEWKAGHGIPYASTWLNERRWEEEFEAAGPDDAPPPKAEAEEGVKWL